MLEITKIHVYLYLFCICSVFANTTEITHTFLPAKGKALPHIQANWLISQEWVNSGKAALRKLVYSEVACKKLASMNKGEVSEAYYRRGSQ